MCSKGRCLSAVLAESLITGGDEMGKAFLIGLAVSILIQGISAEDKTFTGSQGSDWSIPSNWDPPGVPGANDAATVPDGSLCHIPDGQVTVGSITNNGMLQCGNNTISTNMFENTGTMNGSEQLQITPFDDQGLSVFNSGWMNLDNTNASIGDPNWSSITGSLQVFNNYGSIVADKVNIAVDGATNSGFSAVITANDVSIYAKNQVQTGEASLISGNDNDEGPAGSVRIVGRDILNEGVIRGGNSQGHGGGDALVVGIENVNGSRTGLVESGDGNPPGNAAVYAKKILGYWKVHCGSSDTTGTDSANRDRLRGPAHIMADSMVIEVDESHGIDVGTLLVRGDTVAVRLSAFMAILAETHLEMYTTGNGVLDFSNTHQIGAMFVAAGPIDIYANDIIEPPEGLGVICNPSPTIHSADTAILDGHIMGPNTFNSPDIVGAITLTMQNLGTASTVLDFTLSSVRGWVTPVSGSTASLLPFHFDSTTADYTIPAGTEFGIEDTLIAVLTIAPGLIYTSYSTILCTGEPVEITENPAVPIGLVLRATPNPFGSSCRFFISRGGGAPNEISVFDLKGDLIWSVRPENPESQAPSTWVPGRSVGSGVYVVKAASGDREVSRRIVYVK